MPHIFICYRRKDSQHVTGRIRKELAAKFHSREVFIDVHSIAPGVDYRAHLREALSQCQAVLVVIGDLWLNICDEHGQRRLDLPDDDVRIEIETALRLGLLVIPLLVGSAPMPPQADLPESIGPLVKMNAIPVRPDPDFENDLARLLSAIPVDDRVAALQSFAQRAGPMLRRIQAGQQDLKRFARELSDAVHRLMSSPIRRSQLDSERQMFDRASDRSRQLEGIQHIQKPMSEALEHTTPFVNFAYYLDPQIGIGLNNIEEVDQRFREMQAEAPRAFRWADVLLSSLRNPFVPDDLSGRGASLIAELRDQIEMIQSEGARVAWSG